MTSSKRSIQCSRCGQAGKREKGRGLCGGCYREAERLEILDFYSDEPVPISTAAIVRNQLEGK